MTKLKAQDDVTKPEQVAPPPPWLRVHPDIRSALEAGRPVVALETTVTTHGLPRPINLEMALRMEAEVRSAGAEPATVAVLKGTPVVGVTRDELEQLALAQDAVKVSRRDLGLVAAKQLTGGTTVAATMLLAHSAGVRVFATGGIGGVHRGDTGDVSADLTELSRTPVAVICAGAKAILDLPRTLEWLETAGVPVIGWQTDEFPAFFSHRSGLPVSARVDSSSEVAELLKAHWQMGLAGAIICVPISEDVSVPAPIVENALEQAEIEADQMQIAGKDLTPFLLSRLAELTGGATLQANLALLRQNATIAGQIAKALA